MSLLCFENESSVNQNRAEWYEAIKNEFIAHLQNVTWKIVNKRNGKKAIGCKIVLKNKLNLDGTLERKKARLVLHKSQTLTILKLLHQSQN